MAGNLNLGMKYISYYYCISTFKTIVGLVTNNISHGRNSVHEKKYLMSVSKKFVVHSVEYYYCVYYEFL